MNVRSVFLLLVVTTVTATAQSNVPLFRESFDTVPAPRLPSGWMTSIQRSAGGDFITSSSAPRSGSAPNCLSASDARVHQWTVSPPVSFAGRSADSVEFYERRTSTFTAALLLEALIGGDTTAAVRLTDTLLLQPGNNGAYLRRTAPLPDSFTGMSDIRFRWRVVGNPGGGGTAVLRIEDVRVSVKKRADLALTALRAAPASPREGDDLTLTLAIANRAAAGEYSGTIILHDSFAVVTSRPFTSTLAAGDSVSISIIVPGIRSGRHPFTARLLLDEDEDTLNNSIGTVVTAGMRRGRLLINELMYTPLSGMPEWIELVNPGDGPVAPTGWRFSDAGATKAPLSGNGTIGPSGYGIITTDTNAFRSFFDIAAPLFQAPFSALNNSGDAAVLYDRFGMMIDSLSYRSTWGGGTGRSLERIDTASSSTDSASWGTSRHPDGATPGDINSITRKQTDATLRSVSVEPLPTLTGTPVTIRIIASNAGRSVLTGAKIRLILNDAVIDSKEVSPLSPGDSAAVVFLTAPLPQGKYRCAAVIGAEGDGDPFNDSAQVLFTVGVPAASVVITEVMFAPPDGMPEWIELYNRSSVPVDLAGWSIADNGSTLAPLGTAPMTAAAGTHVIITPDPLQLFSFIPGIPETVLVIAAAVPSLNNTTPDAVVLRDGTRRTIDSVRYEPHWLTSAGHSLQRFDHSGEPSDSSNWRSDAPSPGIENPSGRKEYDAGIRSFSAERTADELRLTVSVVNHGRRMLSDVLLQVYHDRNKDGIPAAEESSGQLLLPAIAPTDSFRHTFTTDATTPGKERFIAAVLQTQDEQPSNDRAFASVVRRFVPRTMVINEIMYEPAQDGSEFVELLNRSADTVDTEGWVLMDQQTAGGSRTMVLLSSVPRTVPPGGFL
ncbi:MAG: lamin tail domain-containing protein, partial [Bacteroidetes bacterium]|nr:lamin tail domain-containing protein [Bacteroidota bacterium]